MRTTSSVTIVALFALVSLTACEKKDDSISTSRDATPAVTTRSDTPKPAPAPDNTAKNKVDGGSDTKTPMDQSQAVGEIKITADIRRAIMEDKTMSMNAQNCKIVTEKSGLVTLRGVVNSQAEKDSIEAKAAAVAGVTKVDNQLEVKPG